MRFARPAILPILLLALAACGGDRIGAPAGIDPADRGPTSVISDGSREGGNPNFFFLPPVLRSPSGDPDFDAGAFNGNWKPIVRVCRLATATTCESTGQGAPIYVREYQGAAVSVSLADEHYQVQIDTRETWASTGTYRVHVFLPRREPVLLGFVDVVLAASQQAFRNVNSDELVPLMDGRTIPLKFRIENGASVANTSDFTEVLVTSAGGSFATNTGFAGIAIESGWLPAGLTAVMLTIERVTPTGTANDCHFGGLPAWVPQYEGCYQIETSPSVGIIQADAVVAVCSEAPAVEGQVMYKSDPVPTGGRRLKALENATVPTSLASLMSCGGFTGLASAGPRGFGDFLRDGAIRLASSIGRVVSPRPLYAIDFGIGGHLRAAFDDLSSFGWAVPARVDLSAGDAQTGLVGTLLADTLRVRVTYGHTHHTDHQHGVAGVPVSFTVATGGGTLAVLNATSDVDGYARAFWTLGAAAGAQTVIVTIPSDSSNNLDAVVPARTVTFTANASAPPTVSIFQGDDDITGTTQNIDTDYAENLTISTTGPGPCFLTTNAPSVVNVDGTLAVANGPGAATITAACGTTAVYGTAIVNFVVTAAPASIDSIRVTYATGNVVDGTNAATIFYPPTGPGSTVFTAQPWMGGTVYPSPSCTYTITNPPSFSPVSITASTATTVTLTSSTATPVGTPSQLGITCNGFTRTIAITSQNIPG